MMIEDEELRQLFHVASLEHLQKLDDGLLHLEKQPDDHSHLEELLREAHSLKGDARMLGVKDVETLTHQIEHLLGQIKRREITLSSDLSDRLYQGLEALRHLVNESVTGEPSGVNTFVVLARLMGATAPETPSVPTAPDNLEQAESPPEQPSEQLSEQLSEQPPQGIPESPAIAAILSSIPPAPAPESPVLAPVDKVPEPKLAATIPGADASLNGNSQGVQGREYRIETIRVETRHLDALMTQAGELTVAKIRIAHHLTMIEELVNLQEEWAREASSYQYWDEMRLNRGGSAKSGISSPQRPTQGLNERLQQLGHSLQHLRSQVAEDSARLDTIVGDLEGGIRTLRLLPLSTIFQMMPRLVRELAKSQEKEVELLIEGGDTYADKRILEEMKDPLMHMIRNCVDHGIETPAERIAKGKSRTAKIVLRGQQVGNSIVLEVVDDGRGLDADKIKQTALKRGLAREEELAAMTRSQLYSLIFTPGFSTRNFVTEVSGRGVGLDVVRTNVERLKGSITVESNPGQGSLFRIQLGTTLATAPVMIIQVQGSPYAMPIEYIQTTRLVQDSEIFTLEGKPTIIFDNRPISIISLAHLLELPSPDPTTANPNQPHPCLILRIGEERLGLLVDAWIDQQDVVLKAQSKLLKRVRNIAGATILGTGEVCMILNPLDLLKSLQRIGVQSAPLQRQESPTQSSTLEKTTILLVEDSIATRTQEKRILEAAGYEVVTAVDGLDGYNKLRTRTFQAVISDVQMPNLDGLSLTSKIRQHKEYDELPIILVTSLASDEDKRRGADAGANAYITKGTFNQDVLLETLRRLV